MQSNHQEKNRLLSHLIYEKRLLIFENFTEEFISEIYRKIKKKSLATPYFLKHFQIDFTEH